MYLIPILGCGHDHVGHLEIHIQPLKGCGCAAPAARDDSGGNFSRKTVVARAKEKTIEKTCYTAIGTAIIDGRPNYQASLRGSPYTVGVRGSYIWWERR